MRYYRYIRVCDRGAVVQKNRDQNPSLPDPLEFVVPMPALEAASSEVDAVDREYFSASFVLHRYHRHHRLNYFAAGVYQIGEDQARS